MGPDSYLGSISMFGGNYNPRDYVFCSGQLEPVAEYSALFSVIGDFYGGDGRNTFGIPEFRGRVPMHWGSGPGLTPHRIAEKGGFEEVTLDVAHIPVHTHTANFSAGELNKTVVTYADLANSIVEGSIACSTNTGDSNAPEGRFPAISTPGSYDGGFGGEMNGGMFRYGSVTQLPLTTSFNAESNIAVNVGNTGGNAPFDLFQPYLTVSFCMAVDGLYPPRE